MNVTVEESAPDFTLRDQDEKIHSLHEYRGKWVLIYFYPKDDTPGCTKEACSIRDNFSSLQKENLTILGVSTDSSKSHKKFASKYHLPFPLLADEQKQVVSLYDVWKKKKFMGREYMGTMRTSFLLDPYGIIKKVYTDVKPQAHVQEIIHDMQTFSSLK